MVWGKMLRKCANKFVAFLLLYFIPKFSSSTGKTIQFQNCEDILKCLDDGPMSLVLEVENF